MKLAILSIAIMAVHAYPRGEPGGPLATNGQVPAERINPGLQWQAAPAENERLDIQGNYCGIVVILEHCVVQIKCYV